MKTLKELGCRMVFKKNHVMKCWNGYLKKDDGTKNFIKPFVYMTKHQCIVAATYWANNNPRMLHNVKDPKEPR